MKSYQLFIYMIQLYCLMIFYTKDIINIYDNGNESMYISYNIAPYGYVTDIISPYMDM